LLSSAPFENFSLVFAEALFTYNLLN